jgi:DNA-binding NarL/FixJ family response regulator
VLIAGDDDDIRKRMVAVLSRTYQVVGIVTTAELFQAASCTRPDVIVWDISIPQIDGVAARNKLMAQQDFVPFVFVSRGSSEEATNTRWKEGSFALIFREEVSAHLVNAVEAVHNLAICDSLCYPDFFDHSLQDSKIVVIAEETRRKAEQMILSC